MAIQQTLLRSTMLIGTVGAVYLSAQHVNAADLTSGPFAVVTKAPPISGAAVDGINGKIDGLGGTLANRSIYGSKGSLTLPLGGQYGAQFDGAIGQFDGRAFGSIAGHAFWRNPTQGLVGLYVDHTHWDQFGGIHVTQIAAEGEYYWNRWTLQGIVGVEFGNSVTGPSTTIVLQPPAIGVPGLNGTFASGYDVKTRIFDKVNLSYYITDNWSGYVGHRYLGGKNAVALGSEYAMPLGGGTLASAFVEARVGEGDFHGVWGGVKLYFGQKDKPLIARHRQDDPVNWNPDSLFSIINNYVPHSQTQPTDPLPNPCSPDNCCQFC